MVVLVRAALLALGLAGVSAAQDSLVVELEQLGERTPSDGSFAQPRYQRWASGRHCLFRFHGRGRVVYTVEIPAASPEASPSEWSVWLRYAASSTVGVRAGFVSADDADAELPEFEAQTTGGLEGKHVWGWVRVFRGPLAPGPQRFALDAAPLRPDCLLLTTEPGVPEYLAPRPAPSYDEATLEQLAVPIELARPDWLDELARYELPAWYEGSRVSLHTRLTDKMRALEAFDTLAESYAELGVPSFVRHVKTAGEGAWWPSAVGAVEPWVADYGQQGDPIRDFVDAAHALDLRLIGYYRHMEDAGLALEQPEWVARDDLGQPYLRRRNHPMLCLNSGYADFVEARLVELAQRGVDGLYFDEVHMPKTGCWCAACQTGFTAATGLEHPLSIDEEDPLWRKLREFTNVSIERAFLRWRAAVHAVDPEIVLLISNNTAPDLVTRHTTGRLMRLADATKTEFAKGADPGLERLVDELFPGAQPARATRLAFGWSYCRDGSDGRPPHVWLNDMRTADEALFATAGVVAHGGVANLDHPERTIPDAETFGPAIEAAQSAAQVLAGLRPWRALAIHVPERALDALAPDQEAMWREVIGPVLGAFETALGARIPVSLVTDNQLAEGALDSYRVLYLPAPSALDTDMKRAVSSFAERGGAVLREDSAARWSSASERKQAERALVTQLLDARGEAPLVLEVPRGVHSVFYRDPAGSGRMAVALVNDFGWVQSRDARARAPDPVEGATIRLRHPSWPEVREVVSGEEVDSFPLGGGWYQLQVPVFRALSVVEIR